MSADNVNVVLVAALTVALKPVEVFSTSASTKSVPNLAANLPICVTAMLVTPISPSTAVVHAPLKAFLIVSVLVDEPVPVASKLELESKAEAIAAATTVALLFVVTATSTYELTPSTPGRVALPPLVLIHTATNLSALPVPRPDTEAEGTNILKYLPSKLLELSAGMVIVVICSKPASIN